MKILAIVGGTNDPSNSEMLCDAFLEGARSGGADVEKILLRDMRIEHFAIRHYAPDVEHEEDFRRIQRAVESADGLVVASPIWNFGVPANLKNLIDRFGSFSLDAERRMRGQWKDTPFYLVFTGGSPSSAWTGLLRKTMSGIRIALQYFGGACIGTYFEPKCTPGKGRFELVVDQRPASLAAVRSKGAAFSRVVKTHAETGRLPWLVKAKRKFYKTAQKIQRKFF